MRTRQQIAASRRNLSRRPARPAWRNGAIQRACERALTALGGTITTSDAIGWAYAHRLLILGERRHDNMGRAVRKALESIGAIRIGRAARPSARPTVWRMPDRPR